MKKISLSQKWGYDEMKKVIVSNSMASLVVDCSEDAFVHLEGTIEIDEPFEEFEWEDYIDASFADGILKIDLEEIDAMSHRSTRTSQLLLKIPKQVFLSMEIENLPASFSSLENNFKVISENAPVSISNCQGDKHVESENGPVRIHNSTGNIYAKLENGPFSAEAISGEGLHVESENGPIKIRLGSFVKVDASTENGPIYYETQPIEGGDFSFKTENGIVHLVLPLNFCFSLKAESESGRLKSKLDYPVNKEDNTFRIINLIDDVAPTSIDIETENGMIKLSSDSYINLDYIKGKMEQLKETLQNALNLESENISKEKIQLEKEKALLQLEKLIEYLGKAVNSISEEKVKTKVNDAISKLKDLTKDFDIEGARAAIIVNVEQIGSQVYEGIREGLKNVKAEFDGLKYEHLNAESLKEYINKVVSSPHIKPYLGGDMKQKEKDEVSERSRLKILDMLEAGKITSEEAERLLKAISKE